MSQSDTRDKLINSAVKIFSERGYFNTKVSDIVKDAGVAQGTFYLYFKSKEELFLSIVEKIVSDLERILDHCKNLNMTPEEKILYFGREILNLLNEYREITYIYLFQIFTINEKFKNIYISTNKNIMNFYFETLKDYRNKEILTDIFMGFGKRLLEFNLLIEKKDLNEVVEEFETGVKIIFRGLK
ncbi:TetR/AcrR family transcriptional regulator [Persephonella sp.]